MLVRAFYYTAVTEDQQFSSVRPLLDWLDYNGFTVVPSLPRILSTPTATEAQGQHGHRAYSRRDGARGPNRSHRAFSGGGDFCSLVEAVQRRGVRVTVVSTISRQPPMIADELIRQRTCSLI